MPNSKISALTSATTPLAGTETLPIVQSSTTKQVSVANLTAGRAVSLGVSTIIGPDQTTANITTASNIDAEISSTGSSVFSGGSLVFSAASGAWKFAALKALATNGGGNTQGNLSVSTRRAAADATLTESLQFHASGGISINSGTDPLVGNLLLGTGNLIQGTAAKGVNFTANTPAAGMTSQLLNWYEQGTWTPTLGGTATYTARTANYTRIGRQVTVTCDLTVNVIGTGSTTTISGLPFSALTASAGSMAYFANLNGTYVFIAPIASGSTIVFETMAAAASDATDTTAIFKSGTRVLFTLSYFV